MIFRMRLVQILRISAVLFVVMGGFIPAVRAHEGGPQLMVDPRRFAPGEMLEVRGANLGTDLVVKVELVANDKLISLGEVICDGHGDFTKSFILPEDLTNGAYLLQAIDPSVPGAAVVLASTELGIRTGWLQLIMSKNLLTTSIGILVVVAAIAGTLVLKRQRRIQAKPSQQNVPT